jgi:hypothetical protein
LADILGPTHAEVVSRRNKLAAATPPPSSTDSPEAAKLRTEIQQLVELLGPDHALVKERQERLAEIAPDANMGGGEPQADPPSPTVLLQRKLRYLGILESKLAKQDARVEAAKQALEKAEEDLAKAQARGRELLAKQDQALAERAELAKLVDLPAAPPSAPAWLTKAEELATSAPTCPAAALLAQYRDTAAKLEALAGAPPPAPPPAELPTTPATTRPGDREGDTKEAKGGEERREGRSRTPERDPKRLREGGKGGSASASNHGTA